MTLWCGAGNCRSMERNQSFLFPTDVFHLSGGSKCLVRLAANYSSALATNPTPNFDQFLLKSVSRPVKLLLLLLLQRTMFIFPPCQHLCRRL